ncbi:hypothetical protein CRE_14705 [Caenorhabditis remanei]|uniref:Uncharacterized protein n=1 Tax=Caenorhabditis remanei TaxID=31234 RepID=E3M9N6_CAERE|nr:hypothetical protein CRE_14705 [Caenorhabditis remanei]
MTLRDIMENSGDADTTACRNSRSLIAPLRSPGRTPNNWYAELEQCVNRKSDAVPVCVSNILKTNITIVVNHEEGDNWLFCTVPFYGKRRFMEDTNREIDNRRTLPEIIFSIWTTCRIIKPRWTNKSCSEFVDVVSTLS